MNKVFLAFSFCEQDQALAAAIKRLMASHHLSPVTGENLGGVALTQGVMRRQGLV